ncbi:hypothetical protein CEUSTIGMA_g10363.t1 [Chlamydomonas eustigma]|uniref:Uncharacterized protein n=1 Tax=Chlamydomonas eustigma TaxID=1157962 RepID=A0A250XIT8_9CHLO|nr:hypothetical protein CEUSTIGMA_g10363.t1 [Chlamydomonas eustigma]|eukprot:GAX82936.1 hypothetical protein CEUSTIGMA_g10363.t1 [Chlamydomonas eustigma]
MAALNSGNVTLQAQIQTPHVPGVQPDGGSLLLINFFEPPCASVTSGSAITLGGMHVPLQSCALTLPSVGIADLSFSVDVSRGCTNQCIGALLSVVQLPDYTSLDQPLPPALPPPGMQQGPSETGSHCPCWETPDALGLCSGIQVPITLTTQPEWVF